MRPHPPFRDRAIPTTHTLGDFTLKALSVSDLERDFSAVMESAADIKAAHPGSSWPDGLTKEKNLIDLAWHQREFEARRSFAWVIENSDGSYIELSPEKVMLHSQCDLQIEAPGRSLLIKANKVDFQQG